MAVAGTPRNSSLPKAYVYIMRRLSINIHHVKFMSSRVKIYWIHYGASMTPAGSNRNRFLVWCWWLWVSGGGDDDGSCCCGFVIVGRRAFWACQRRSKRATGIMNTESQWITEMFRQHRSTKLLKELACKRCFDCWLNFCETLSENCCLIEKVCGTIHWMSFLQLRCCRRPSIVNLILVPSTM